jgi:hypothetical protein
MDDRQEPGGRGSARPSVSVAVVAGGCGDALAARPK